MSAQALHESHGPAPGINLAQHTPSHRMCGIKFALLARNGSFWRVLRVHGELSTVFATNKPSRANFFARSAQKHGDDETNDTTAHPKQGTAETDDTSAPEKRTKNAHFSPTKATVVSNPHRHKRAKAMAVSDHRAIWLTAHRPTHTHAGPEAMSGPAISHLVSLTRTWAR